MDKLKSGPLIPLAIAVLLSISGAILPVLWTMPVLPVTLCILLASIIYAGGKLQSNTGLEKADLSHRMEIILIVAVTITAFLLRVPQLATNPPGILVDEAYQGLQGVAHWTGEKLPPVAEHETPPDYPFWSLLEALSTRTLGVNIEAIRLPAAIIGTLSIPLAWFVMRSLFGGVTGLFAALFLCGSFWHVHNSRLALPLASLVAESLTVAWLLLASSNTKRRWAPPLAGMLCGYSIFGYSAGLYLPAWGLAATIIQSLRPADGRNSFLRPIAFALGLGTCIALVSTFNPVNRQMGRTQNLLRLVASGVETARPAIIANFFATVKTTNGQWANHPRGAPRLSPLERILLVLGLVAIIASGAIPLSLRLGLPLWLACAMLPEFVPGGVHLSRGIGALAPLAGIMGLGGALITARWGRRGLFTLLALGLANTGLTAWHMYANFPQDPQARSWYQYVASESSADIVEMSQFAPVKCLKDNFNYKSNPAGTFLLWNEIRDGHIQLVDDFPLSDLRPMAKFYPDPATGDPLMFILVGPNFPKDRRILPASIMHLLVEGDMLEQAGKYREAESFYRDIIGALPPSRYAQMKLGNLLTRMGRRK